MRSATYVYFTRSPAFLITRALPRTAEDPALFVSFARIENHYFVNNGWFEPEQLIKGIEAVRAAGIPGVIVQGG